MSKCVIENTDTIFTTNYFIHDLLSKGIFSFTLGQGINHVEHEKQRMIEEWKSYSQHLDVENYDESITILNFLPINVEQDNFWE